MRTPLFSNLTTIALLFASCQSTAGDGTSPQVVIETTANQNSDCTRLTLHCVQDDGSTKVCASTATERVGTASDPEDLQAMKTGETVVLEEGDAFDVTVPILMTDGKWTTVCGVTIKANGKTREQTVEAATAIAMTVKNGLSECCKDGSCCSK